MCTSMTTRINGKIYISWRKSLSDVRSQTRYHAVYGTAAPPVGNAGGALGVEAVRGEIDAGAGEGAPAKSAKSAGVNVG